MHARQLCRALAASTSALLAALAATTPATGQTVDIPLDTVPMSDVDCNFTTTLSLTTVPACSVDGTRTVTLQNTTRSTYNSTLDRITSTYNVAFSGNLQVDAAQVVLTPGSFQWPSGVTFSFGAPPEVNLSANYTGTWSNLIANSALTPSQNVNRAYFVDYTDFSTNINSIYVNEDDGWFETADYGEYSYTLRSIDSTAVQNNGVSLIGRFSGTAGNGAIQFGTIGGTATLVEGPIRTPFPASSGAVNTGLLSPFALEYALNPVITTQLDETGLITPTVAVTNGIVMHGSKITQLAAGTAPTDAVIVAQLSEETLARAAAISTLQTALANEAATRTAAVATLQSNVMAESAARLAADNAMAGRIAALESQVASNRRYAAAGTAVATALSGATFLPGTAFNVTANVGAYDGAKAAAVQMNVLASPNVALNAGLATGFNYDGKTAGRIGITFGW